MISAALTCPDCGTSGRFAHADQKSRAVFFCPALTCDVVEYDHEIIRQRGSSTGPSIHHPNHPTRQSRTRGQPFWWSRQRAAG